MIGIAGKLDTVGAGDASFSSVGVFASLNRLTVYRTSATSSVDEAQYSSVVPSDVSITFAPAKLSKSQMEKLTALVSEDMKDMKAAGVTPVDWGNTPGEPGGPFLVHYMGPAQPPESVVQALSIYGKDTVSFAQVAGPTASASRQYDSSRFHGGANIVGTAANYAHRTSGFGDLSSIGSHYMITAYHCVNPADPRFWANVGGNYMGSATASDLQWDAAYIKTPTQPFVYDNPYGSPDHTKQVVGVTVPYFGLAVCGSGSVSFAVCSASATAALVTWTSANHYTGATYSTSGFAASRRDNALFVAEGDSGGPIFNLVNNNSAMMAMGIYSAFPYSAQITGPSYVPANTRCAYTAYAGKVSQMADAHSLNLTQ